MAASKKFINTPSTALSDTLSGLLKSHPQTLTKLHNHDVIIHARYNPTHPNYDPSSFDRVAVLSGGGSGHEPAHAGFIGDGMLAGAVCGGVFASPPVSAILAAIRAVTKVGHSNGGCLLIVKNYTGDRLNFGMACEKANAEGRNTKLVASADDCAVKRSKGITGRRGVAGTIFVHKVAGAIAANGGSLDEVFAAAKKVTGRLLSIGASLSTCALPGEAHNPRLDGDIVEIGLGIHGEAGMLQSAVMQSNELAKIMVKTLVNFGYGDEYSGEDVKTVKDGDKVVILINNLGGTSNLEMGIVASDIHASVTSIVGEGNVTRMLVGSFMTSFNMHGLSATILVLDDEGEIEKCLNQITNAPAWLNAEVGGGVTDDQQVLTLPASDTDTANSNAASFNEQCSVQDWENVVNKCITAATNAIQAAETELTDYDRIVGDGDCGITMQRGATEILKRLTNNTLSMKPAEMCKDLADAISSSMGGTSGVLFELALRKISNFLIKTQQNGTKSITKEDWAAAFIVGVETIQYYGAAELGYRTMVDALVPAATAFKAGSGIADAAAMCRAGAEGTKNMGAKAGRSNYLPFEVMKGTPDPGAVAVAIILESISGVVE